MCLRALFAAPPAFVNRLMIQKISFNREGRFNYDSSFANSFVDFTAPANFLSRLTSHLDRFDGLFGALSRHNFSVCSC